MEVFVQKLGDNEEELKLIINGKEGSIYNPKNGQFTPGMKLDREGTYSTNINHQSRAITVLRPTNTYLQCLFKNSFT